MLLRPFRKSRRDFLRCLAAPLVLPAVGGGAWKGPLLALAKNGFAESGQGRQPSGGLFRDVAREAGINATLTCGSSEKNWILEVYGSGCVWFDYNNDGYVDLFIVNGSTIDNLLNPSLDRESIRGRNGLRLPGPAGESTSLPTSAPIRFWWFAKGKAG